MLRRLSLDKTFFIYFIICLLCLFNLYFSVSVAKNQIWTTAFFDDSRDVLVAKHIVEYQENVTRGPWTDGGDLDSTDIKLLSSPLYYWLIAVLWFFQPSVEVLVP